MPQKSAPELFALVHYLHRLSTEGKRGAKMALESCPKCHFIMLEGVLMTIEEHGQNGTIYVSDLAAAVKQPLPAVSRALRQLEQDGLIERITDPNDRRKTLVRPTEKGLDASRQVEAAISRYFERVICRIPEEQREQLFSLTGVLLEAVEAENAEHSLPNALRAAPLLSASSRWRGFSVKESRRYSFRSSRYSHDYCNIIAFCADAVKP